MTQRSLPQVRVQAVPHPGMVSLHQAIAVTIGLFSLACGAAAWYYPTALSVPVPSAELTYGNTPVEELR